MKFFSIEENIKVLKTIFSITLLSILSYAMLVLYILPSSKYFVNYNSDEKFRVVLYKNISPSVVQLLSGKGGGAGSGSGVYIADYLVVTNSHVASLSTKEGMMTVVTGRDSFQGKVLENYPKKDLALVYTPKNKGVPVRLGNSDMLEVGEEVISIGSPFGHYNTLGTGYITGLGRSLFLPPYISIISSSAGIMPGSSGGGLFDLKGNLVGIPFAGVRNNSTLGFVIPVNVVREKFKFYLRR